MMKTILVSCSMLIALVSFGQATNYPDGSTVADFTVTDVEGETHSLYEITAQGKHVVLDFFFDTCPPCQQTQPTFNQLYQTYGCNSHDLFVISINNGTDSDAEVIAYEATFGGSFAHSPAVSADGGGGTVNSAFGVFAWPTYVLIGPDNIMKNNDIWPIQNMQTFINAFPSGSNIQPAQCAAVGIEENEQALMARVFPSPSSGVVTFEMMTTTTSHVTINVIDAIGRTIHKQDLGVRAPGVINDVMDLGILNNGNYMLRVLKDGQLTSVHQLVIAK